MSKEIKIYEAKIEDFNDGIFAISLVDRPAVERNFVLFKADDGKTAVRFKVEDPGEHIISGVVMLADTPIYRRNGDYEYYVTYSRDTIKKMAQKMLSDYTFNNIDLQHDGKYIGGISLVELYIKDDAKGISPGFVDSVPDGSLMASFKVDDEQLWDEIKDGDSLNGFSLEGLFTIEETKQNSIMSKIGKFVKNLMKYSEIETGNGKLFWGEGELEVGVEVYVEDENGEKVAAPDGEYQSDEKTIVVEEGKVKEITIKDEKVEIDAKQHFAKVVALMEETYEEKIQLIAEAIRAKGFDAWVVEAADSYAVAEVWVDEIADYKHYRFPITWDEEGKAIAGDPEEVKSEFVPVDEEKPAEEPKEEVVVEEFENEEPVEEPVVEEKVNKAEYDAKIAEVEAKLADLTEKYDALADAIAALEQKPAAEPIAEEFAKVSESSITGMKQPKAARLFSSLR